MARLTTRERAQAQRDRWKRLLAMPTSEEIDRALDWMGTRQSARAMRAYYVDGDVDRDTGADYCRACAEAVAADWKAKGAEGVYIGLQETSDGASWCETCGRRLRIFLTDYGVDTELGITETDPLHVGFDLDSAEQCAIGMGPGDPRWSLWMWHVDVLRALARAA